MLKDVTKEENAFDDDYEDEDDKYEDTDDVYDDDNEYIDEDGDTFYLFHERHSDGRLGKTWWADYGKIQKWPLFTFDKKRLYYFFADYPDQLTPKEKEIFDKENPYWVNKYKKRGLYPR